MQFGCKLVRNWSFNAIKHCQLSSVEPSFVIHPRSKLGNSENQGFTLTNSRETSHPPPGFVEVSQHLDVTPWKKLIEKSFVFEQKFESRAVDTIHHNSEYLSVVQNLLKVVFSQSSSHVSLKDLHTSGDYHVNSSWHFAGNRIDVRGRPGILVKSRKSFQKFFADSPLAEDSSTAHQLNEEDVFSRLNEWGVRTHHPIIDSERSISEFPYYHTLITFCKSPPEYDTDIQNAVLYLHGLAINQSYFRTKHGKNCDTECVQGIVTDGRRFSFIWYQLNFCPAANEVKSLTEGSKNTVAVIRHQYLCDSVIQTTRRQDHTSWELSSYSDTVLRNFISLFLW